MARVRVACPATSANLGPGFDALGLALALPSRFAIAEAPDGFEVTAAGPEADRVAGGGADNLVVRAFQAAREACGLAPAPGLRIEVDLGAPPARGLGSSATAVVAGVLAADALAGGRLDERAKVELVTAVEGHPDNVVPCLLGGLCVTARDAGGGLTWARTVPGAPPGLVVAVPARVELSTEVMRSALPAEVPHGEAAANGARAALLVLALVEGRPELLATALFDRLHEPYRGPHVPGLAAVRDAARGAGAYGVAISGSGPTLLAFCPRPAREAVARAMADAWGAVGVVARALPVEVDGAGAVVDPVPRR